MTTDAKKRIKVGLMGASFHSTNMGVSALASASIKCILKRWPEAEVTFFGSCRTASTSWLKVMDKEVMIRQVPIRFCMNIFLPTHFLKLAFYACLLKLLPFRALRNFLMAHNSSLKLILQTDFFADITGGDSFSDIYGLQRFVFGFLRKLLPIMFSKKLVLLPQTYGPFRKPLAKYMAHYILKRSNIIYSRDRAGAEYVNSILSDDEDNVHFVPDVAFVLDSRKPSNMDIGSLSDVRTDKSIVVGLNVSGLLYYDGSTNNNMFRLKEDYKQIICRIIDFLMSKRDVLILLVPHIFPPAELIKAEIVENDVAACLDIYKKFHTKYPAKIFRVCGKYDQSEIKYIIGLCNFFMGSRMHSCIAALSQNIPAIGLAYSKKFFGVFSSVGMADQVIDLRSQNMEAIGDYIERIFKERGQIAQKLSQEIPKAQKRVLSFLNQIDVD